MVRVDFLGFRNNYDEVLLALALNDAQTLWIDYAKIGMPYMALVFSAYTQRYRDKDYTKHVAAQGVVVPAEEIADLEDYLRGQGVQSIPLSLALIECTLCTDPVDPNNGGTRLQCGHTWHARCVANLFEKTTVDESLFPPRCCEEIALADVQHVLSPELHSTFSEKSIEFRTLNRIYCVTSTCSKFLGAQTSQPAALACQACSTTTCSACKGSHPIEPGLTCEQNIDELKMAELAKASGWMRCSTCSRMVERTTGCNHMTCVCKSQFCYKCGKPWPHSPACS